jgi:hypothetical protein
VEAIAEVVRPHRAVPDIAPPGSRQRSAFRSVALPSEHGGWGLTLEPTLLGLLVAWSWPGLALGAAAMLAFLARTPIKVVLVDRWRHRWLDRSRYAARVAVVEVAVIVGLAVLVALGAHGTFWMPFAAAAPLVAVEMWFDMRSRSRRLIPELAGTVGIGSVAAAIALADGVDARIASGLWCVVAARGVAAIPYVRTQVFRLHNRPHRRWHSDVAQLVAVLAVAVGWALDAVRGASVVAIAVLASVNVAAVRLNPRPAKVIGLQQMLFGFVVVGLTATAVLVA